MRIVVSESVRGEYGARIRKADPKAKFVVPLLRDGKLAWDGDPAAVDVCLLSEDFWQDLELRQLAIPAIFRLEGLRWFHTFSAGTDSPAFAAIIDRGAMLTNSTGASAPSIAQYVLGMMLYRSKRFDELRDQQRRREWTQLRGRDLTGQTVGIIGTGAIGGEVARLAKAFGMHVIGARRSEKKTRHVDAQVSMQRVGTLLQRSDFVVIACPLTKETEGLIGERELRMMKPDATLINIARGKIIDEPALVRALRENWIAGACLDVFTWEPLPETSPLWELPNVFVTPHSSGISPLNMERAMAIFLDNLERLVQGKKLRNLVRI
ncbi:MAG TPA: D-2-hydroxyacid dehydrogenase [Dehalococcoidia bacterium]|jgi:phosphoglycerate dehydrogenase-like enzyme